MDKNILVMVNCREPIALHLDILWQLVILGVHGPREKKVYQIHLPGRRHICCPESLEVFICDLFDHNVREVVE
jgi:hypothetical protein